MGVDLSFIKKNGRTSFRSNRRYNSPKTYSSFSSNKSRPKGNTENLFYKYIKMAKEASSTGDRIQAEYYYQFAEHYSRNMNDASSKKIANENINEVSDNKNTDDSLDFTQVTNKPLTDKDNISSKKIDSTKETEESEKSLDTVSFISKPPKKITKSKK